MANILIIDDEKNIRDALKTALKMEGMNVIGAEDGADGLEKLSALGADGVIVDLKMPKMDGLEFIRCARELNKNIPIIMLTGHGGVDEAVEAMKQGAYDFLSKPINIEKLLLVLERALEDYGRRARQEQLEQMVEEKFGFENIIGHSGALNKVLTVVRQVAPTDASVLITGESGTGKEVVASAIHYNSPRKDKPFIKVHCAALPETLLESELFGHEKGAFTGAIARKKGRFEMANGGTIFLDEIGEISPLTQVKLLRVLQEREFERVGGEESIHVDIRIIAATNRDLTKEVKEGRFREDLYYRLKVVYIEVPPLRERKEDILLLAKHFLKEFSKRHHKGEMKLSAKVQKLLEIYNWPGNVRELQNVIENAVVLSSDNTVYADILPEEIRNEKNTGKLVIDLGVPMNEIEKRAILATLDKVEWNKSEAARVLAIGRKTLLRKLDQYGVKSAGN